MAGHLCGIASGQKHRRGAWTNHLWAARQIISKAIGHQFSLAKDLDVRTKGGLNSKPHAVCDGQGRPLIMLLSEGQMSDYKGAALMIDALPKAKSLFGDKGYDADLFREALANREITACIPSKANRKTRIPHDAALCRQRHKIENMFGRLKDGRSIHTSYGRCAHTFMSAIRIAATLIFWIDQ